MSTPLDAKTHEDLLEQAMGVRLEKDRIKLIKTALAKVTITAEQAIAYLETVRFGDAKVDMAANCHPHMSDDFEKVLAALPYEEDRVAVRAKIKA